MVNYPGSLDTSASLPRAVDGTTPVSSSQYNQTRDAVIAIETELGVLPSATYGTVRNRLDYLESYIIAGGGVQLAQDLGGLATAPLVIGLYGNPVLSTTPTLNYVLTWNGLAWEPKAPSIAGGDHNTLGSLQGGTSSQYYHLTSAQHAWLIAGVTSGYWSEVKGGTGQTTYATGDLLYSDGTNSLGKLSIGSEGYILKVSSGVPIWSEDSSISSHNLLSGIQGGSGSDGYYHFTSSEHTWLQDGYVTGYWSEVKGGTGQSTYTTGDLLYSDGTNSLGKLSIGSEGETLTVSGGIPIWSSSSAPTAHNALTGIQGGEADGYYHLTPGEHQFVIDGYDNGVFNDGYQLSINNGFVEWAPGYYHALFVGKIGSVAASTDGYLLQNLSISSTEDFPAFVTPIQSKAAKMRVRMSQAPGAGESVTVTLRKNGSNTSLSVTVSESDTTGSNLTNLVSMILGGSKMTVRVQTTSGAVVEDLSVVLVFYPDNIIA